MTEHAHIIESYGRLRLEWGKSRRFQGGINALQGFDYQLLSTLLKIVKSDTRSARVLSEQLSDITEIQNGKIIVTQSKLTLSSKALHEALEELWDIFLLISQEFPKLESIVCYSIQSSRQEIKNPESSIENWGIKAKNVSSLSLVNPFLSKVSITIEPGPLDRFD